MHSMVSADSSKIRSSSTRIYVIALSLVALLSIFAFVTIHLVISEHRGRAATINTSGRQRMLSQRIGFLLMRLNAADASQRNAILSTLNSTIDEFEQAHQALSLGSEALGIPIVQVKDFYFNPDQHLDQDVKNLVHDLREVTNETTAKAQRNSAQVMKIDENLESILKKLDQVVKLNQAASENQVEHLHQVEIIILFLTLTLLLIEALFIFRPLVRKVSHLIKEAIEAREVAVQATDAKSAFLATITHEIRTPLTGVYGIIEDLSGSGLPVKQGEQIQMLFRLTGSLISLVNDILDYSKIEAGKLSIEQIDFNLAAMISDTSLLFGSSAKAKDIQLFFELDSQLPEKLSGDPTRIRQVIANFVGNALKFTPMRGTIRVKLAQLEADQSQPNFTRLRIEVQDSGCGIPLAAQSQIFGKFNQADASTHRKHGGTGLGLAISKQIVELMGGVIGFESNEGKGSVFWMEVILAPAQHLPAVLFETEKFGIGKRILFAEDDLSNQVVMKKRLLKLGFDVQVVSNGQEAVNAAMSSAFDLILLDCEMPILNGFESAAAIRMAEVQKNLLAVPIIAMTGHAASTIRERGLKAGFNAFVTKPVMQKALCEALLPWLKTPGEKDRVA